MLLEELRKAPQSRKIAEGGLERETWFSTRIWYVDFDKAVSLNKRLLRAIRDWQKEDPEGITKTNLIGWHSQDDLHRREEFRDLIDHMYLAASDVGASLKLREDQELVLDNAWVNVSPKYASNRMHVHARDHLSGVYYVQTPENCGNISFRDPRPQVEMWDFPYGEINEMSTREVSYPPTAGRMLLFPSWLAHEVRPNMSDEDRISIAFNFFYRAIRKPAAPEQDASVLAAAAS